MSDASMPEDVTSEIRTMGDKIAKKLPEFMSLSTNDRFEKVWSAIFDINTEDYKKPGYTCAPKYTKGDNVVVFSGRLFWNVKIVKVDVTKHIVVEGKRGKEIRIPAYKLEYVGWGKQFNESVAEVYIWASDGPQMVSFQMLYAYFWNKYEISRHQAQNKSKKLKTSGSYEPSAESVQKLEAMWKSEAQSALQMRFSEFVGMSDEI